MHSVYSQDNVYELPLGCTKCADKAFTSTTPLPGVPIQLQRTLLDPENQSLRPDEQFLELLAGVVKSECPSLVSILSLTSTEMEEVEKNRKQLSQSELSLQMLKKWATREEATYGQLCQKLKTISLF